MTNYDQASGAGTLRLVVTQGAQNIALNQTTLNWALYLICGNGISNNYSGVGYALNINGSLYGGSYTFDFSLYSTKTIAASSTVVTHNADGTKTANVAGHTDHTGTSAIGGPIDAWGTFTPTPIPRATTPTVSPTSGDTGVTYTIGHNPASSSFYHDVAYALDGVTFTNIATNVVGSTLSTSWTPAHTLLPNDASKTVTIRLITRASSGGTIIGTKTVNLPLTVPTSVKPTISAVAWADAQVSSPDMPTLMGGSGRFVQRWSKLKPTVTSAGASGSTITDTDIIQNGQTTDSGVAFTNPIALSGAVPYTAYADDSRNRTSDPYVNTVAVTAYNYPSLPTPTVVRTSDAGGTTPSSTGTYLKVTPAASASSLNFSGEKNLLEWQIRSRPAGGSWTTEQAWTNSTVSGVTWTTPKMLAGKSASTEWEIEVSIRDLFGKNGYAPGSTVVVKSVLVPSEAVQFDFDEDLGLGIGEYRRSAFMLSVAGPIAQNGGRAVVDTVSLPGLLAHSSLGSAAVWTVGVPADLSAVTGMIAGDLANMISVSGVPSILWRYTGTIWAPVSLLQRASSKSAFDSYVTAVNTEAALDFVAGAQWIDLTTGFIYQISSSTGAYYPVSGQLIRPTAVTNGSINADGSISFSGVASVRGDGLTVSPFSVFRIEGDFTAASADDDIMMRLGSGSSMYTTNNHKQYGFDLQGGVNTLLNQTSRTGYYVGRLGTGGATLNLLLHGANSARAKYLTAQSLDASNYMRTTACSAPDTTSRDSILFQRAGASGTLAGSFSVVGVR